MVEPRMKRNAHTPAMRRQQLEALIEQMIAMLDEIDGDENLEDTLEIGSRAQVMELASAIGETIHRARELAIINQSVLELIHAHQSAAGDAYDANR